MKNYTTVLPILSAARFVAEMPKDSDTINLGEDDTAAGNAVNHLSAFPLF